MEPAYRPTELSQHPTAFQTIPPSTLDPRMASVPAAELVSKAALNPKPMSLVESKDDDTTYNYFASDAQETSI